MKIILLKLVPYILAYGTGEKAMSFPDDHPIMKRASIKAEEVIEVVESMVEDPIQQEAWARSIFGWQYWEASWLTRPKGYNDDGKACGVMQIHNPHKIIPGVTCEMLKKDSKLSVKVALTYLLEREKTCGSKAAAWSAYSWDGNCHKDTLYLVKRRFKTVGLSPNGELPIFRALPNLISKIM